MIGKIVKIAGTFFPVLKTIKEELSNKVFELSLDKLKTAFRKALIKQLKLYVLILLLLVAAALPTYYQLMPNPWGVYLSALVWQAILLFFCYRFLFRVKAIVSFFKTHPNILKKGRKYDDIIILILSNKYQFFPKVVNYYVERSWMKKTVDFLFPLSKLLQELKKQTLKEAGLFICLIGLYNLVLHWFIMPVMILDPNHMTRLEWMLFPFKIFFVN